MKTPALIIYELLGKADALWQPVRGAPGCLRAVLYEARADFRARGLRWASDEAGSVGRKRKQLDLERAARRGEVELVKERGRTSHVRISSEAEDLARGVLGLPRLAEALAAVDELRRLNAGRPHVLYVRETTLAGVEYGKPRASEALASLEWDLSGLLLRGLMEANSDIERRVFYYLSPAGAALAEARAREGRALPWPMPRAARCPHGEWNKPCELHSRAFSAERERLRNTSRPAGGEIGEIPLPVSGDYL